MDEPTSPRPQRLRPLLLGMGWFPDQPGGLNRYLRCLYEALADGGQAPAAVVVGPARDAPSSVHAASELCAPLPRRLATFAKTALRLGRNASVVDAHFAPYALAALLAGTARRCPLVVHFQGPWADESRAAGQGRTSVTTKRLIERAVYRRADLLITLSGAFKRVLVEQYAVAPWRIDVIPPGVDLDRFCPGDPTKARAQLGMPPGAWMAATVRRLVPRMGLDILLSAWADVVRSRPGARLMICGDGPQRPALEAQARRLGIGHAVSFLGRVDDATLVAAYRAADVSVVPTAELEGFGLVTLESLACGTPVVVTDVAGLADAPRRLDPSLVVAPGDPRALADRLAGTSAGSHPLPSSSACRSFAEGYSWAEVARRHVEHYRRLEHAGGRRKLRVVYVDHVAELSGGELALLRLLPALAQVDAHVILAENGPLVGRLLQAGISVEVLAMTQGTRQLRRDHVRLGSLPVRSLIDTAAYIARLTRRLHLLGPDIVHTNSLKAALYGGLAARICRRPLVWHVRDRVAPDYLPRLAVRIVRALARWLPDGVIANSKATMATIGPRHRGSQAREVVASPVDLGEGLCLAEHDPVTTDSPLRVVMVGRLDRWKGQHVFLQAFAAALEGRPATALIVGGSLFGQADYEREVKELAGSLGIERQVEFLGHRDDVSLLLRSCHVLVHASTIPEPFGQVCVEGMAAGLAVVGADAGGPAEVITHEVDGLLVFPGDVEGLAAALGRLAGDDDLRSRLGRAATETAKAYRPDVLASKTMAVYQAVMAG